MIQKTVSLDKVPIKLYGILSDRTNDTPKLSEKPANNRYIYIMQTYPNDIFN